MDIQLGYWRWKIFRWNEHPNPFRGRSDLALEWLRRFQNDRMIMSELRDKLTAAGANTQLWSDDNRVLQEVAYRLSSGEFFVCAESSHPFNAPTAAVVPPDPTAGILQTPPPPPPAPAPAPEPEPEPTLSPDSDAARIASNLQQAAQEGTPFCEECCKVAPPAPPVAPSPTPPAPAATPPASTLPDTADAEAIADSLVAAARNGTPFCAECERARLALQQQQQSRNN